MIASIDPNGRRTAAIVAASSCVNDELEICHKPRNAAIPAGIAGMIRRKPAPADRPAAAAPPRISESGIDPTDRGPSADDLDLSETTLAPANLSVSPPIPRLQRN